MDQNTNEKQTRKAGRYNIKKIPKDDPIYSRGFMFGITNSQIFPTDTPVKDSQKEKKE